MSRGRASLPGASSLFRGPGESAGAPAAAKPATANTKLSVYMPDDLVAELDELRMALRRQGIIVDRSRVLRDAARMVLLDDRAELIATLQRPEEGAA